LVESSVNFAWKNASARLQCCSPGPDHKSVVVSLISQHYNEVIVALKAGVDPANFFANPEFSGYRPLLGTSDQFVATLAEGGSLKTLASANRLNSDPSVVWAAPNGKADFRPAAAPNDTQFGNQWHLHNTAQITPHPARSDADADLVEAWDTTTGHSDIVIAILASRGPIQTWQPTSLSTLARLPQTASTTTVTAGWTM
jgi:hypothetical protein